MKECGTGRRRWWSLCAATAALFIGGLRQPALSDNKSDDGSATSGSGSAAWEYEWSDRSRHFPEEHNDYAEGDEWVGVQISEFADGGLHLYYDSQADQWHKLIDDPMTLSRRTPLGGENYGVSREVKVVENEETVTKGYIPFVVARSTWDSILLVGSEGKVKVEHRGQTVVDDATYAAHSSPYDSITVYASNIPTFDWDSAPPLTADMYDSGVPAMAYDEQTEQWTYVEDENGDLQWEIPPALQFRLTSSVESAGGDAVTYTYLLENFTDDAYNFLFEDIKSTQYPSGWCSTVPANDTATLTWTVGSPGQNVWLQRSQADLSNIRNAVVKMGMPVAAYTPESMAAFPGEVDISSATYNQLLHRCEIVFTVTAQAEELVLYRVSSEGTEIACNLKESIQAAVDHTLIDENPPTGEYTYFVFTGVRVSAVMSESAELEVP